MCMSVRIVLFIRMRNIMASTTIMIRMVYYCITLVLLGRDIFKLDCYSFDEATYRTIKMATQPSITLSNIGTSAETPLLDKQPVSD